MERGEEKVGEGRDRRKGSRAHTSWIAASPGFLEFPKERKQRTEELSDMLTAAHLQAAVRTFLCR